MTPPPARFRLPDGRHLAVRSHGPVDGTPVLFVPGAAAGSALHFGGPQLAARGVRLVAVDRPGLGFSDPDPGKTLASVGADIARLARPLGGPLPVVAHSQGAPFALAAARAGAATRLVLVSPVDDVGHPAVAGRLPEPLRTLVRAVAADPASAAARFAAFTPDAFVDFLLRDHPAADAPVYADPGFRRLLRAAVGEGFRQGPDGYARDTMLAMQRWPLDLGAVDMPVTVLMGADDAVHAVDRGAGLTARLRGAERTVVPGVGGALLWARPELVLDAALAAADARAVTAQA